MLFSIFMEYKCATHNNVGTIIQNYINVILLAYKFKTTNCIIYIIS